MKLNFVNYADNEFIMKFFRKFRMLMIKKQKVLQYLSYALGEITLVVIGILVALYVNDWNGNRQKKQLEIKALKEIENSLLKNKEIIELHFKYHQQNFVGQNKLYSHLKEKGSYNDTLARYFSSLVYDYNIPLNLSGYENFKVSGIPLLTNDSLKLAIISFYDEDLNVIYKIFPQQYEDLLTYQLNPEIIANFEIVMKGSIPLLIPNDYNAVVSNVKFLNLVSFIVGMNHYGIGRYQDTLDSLDILLAKVNEEIVQLEQ